MTQEKIAVLGAGSWGTAVAIHLARTGNEVILWTEKDPVRQELKTAGENRRYLPGIAFPQGLKFSSVLNSCLSQASLVIIALPSHAFSGLVSQINSPIQGLAWLTKGLNPQTQNLLSVEVLERFGREFPIAVISGPSFAAEVAKGLPTALTLAGNNALFSQKIQACFHRQNVRVYLNQDLVAVQLAGAVKNVLAIACGISDGLGFGSNAKAALITRGLAEMRRLGRCLGAEDESFLGLAGVGDLVLTCTDDQSRNRRFGLKIGQGLSVEAAEASIAQVIEGKDNAKQVCLLAERQNIEMPICEQVYSLIEGRVTPSQAVLDLMNRSAKEE